MLQAVVTLYALHIVQLEKTGELGMSLIEKMLSQLNAAVVVVVLDADCPGQSLIDAVQENKRYVPAVQLLIVIQIWVWQGALTGFDDQAPGRAAADLLQEFPLLCHLIVCGVHLQRVPFSGENGADIADQFRIDMFLFAADEQRDGVAGIICGQAGGVRAAALSGGDQSLGA